MLGNDPVARALAQKAMENACAGPPGKDGKDGAPGKDGTPGTIGPSGTAGYLHVVTTTDAAGTAILTFPAPYATRPNIRLTVEVAATVPYHAQFAFVMDGGKFAGIGIRTFRLRSTTLGATLATLVGQIITPHEVAPSVPVHVQVVPL